MDQASWVMTATHQLVGPMHRAEIRHENKDGCFHLVTDDATKQVSEDG